MQESSKYFNIRINKIIIKNIIKYPLIIIFLYYAYIFLCAVFFLTDYFPSYTPSNRYGLSFVLENAFTELSFECEKIQLDPIEQNFLRKHQIFDPSNHDYNYLFGMGKENCLAINSDHEWPVIPHLPIWYKDTDPIKVSLGSTKILEDQYVFSKILDMAKRPCKFIPSKEEILLYEKQLLDYYRKLSKNDIDELHYKGFISRTISRYLNARESLECDIESPKNEEVQLYFHNYKGPKTAITVKLQRQGE